MVFYQSVFIDRAKFDFLIFQTPCLPDVGNENKTGFAKPFNIKYKFGISFYSETSRTITLDFYLLYIF